MVGDAKGPDHSAFRFGGQNLLRGGRQIKPMTCLLVSQISPSKTRCEMVRRAHGIMLWLAYELHGRPVYTGVCRTNGHDVEDDWMLFAWNDAHLIAQRSDSSLCTPRGWILPVDVAPALRMLCCLQLTKRAETIAYDASA